MLFFCPYTVVGLLLVSGSAQASMLPCKETSECERALSPGSMCLDGLCTNSFYNGGCLKHFLPDWKKTRICNSQDPPDAEAMGLCRHSPMDYTEVRIQTDSWASVNFLAWLLQIVLSELLDIPTSIEAGSHDISESMNFYNKQSGFEYWNILTSLAYNDPIVAAIVGDCRKVTSSPENYERCSHIYPETWDIESKENPGDEFIEPFRDVGIMAESAMFVPRFAVEQDPTLSSFIGLQGEKNRRKLAELFKRPTRWGQYCREVSPTNCTVPDMVAHRAPQNQAEEARFYMDGFYSGHFRYTKANDCDLHPSACTGHFIDYPCGWTSLIQQQAYHLDIAFAFEGPEANGGYDSNEAEEIWLAANATKSPVAMYWWTPQPLQESFIGTDAEFVRVFFPSPTQECVDSRADMTTQCDPNVTIEDKMGSPLGVCDSFQQSLKVTLSTGLRKISEDSTVDKAFWSPAHAVASSFQLNSRQLNQIFRYWQDRELNPQNFDARAAVCWWASENLELLEALIPESHPRVVEEVDSSGEPLFVVAFLLAMLAGTLVSVSMFVSFMKRKTKALYYAQSESLFLIQFGMLLTVGGAICYAQSASTAACGLTPWLTNLGYVLQLIPLGMRIAVIQQLAAAGKQMERVRLTVWKLYCSVAAGAIVVATFLLVWTLMDPPQEQFQYEGSDHKTADGETIIYGYNYCGSEDNIWYTIQFVWRAAFLVPACLIALLALQVQEDLNDTRSLSFVLFVRLSFQIVMATVGLATQNTKAVSGLMGYWSILLSADTIVSVIVYIWPKFLFSGEGFESDPLPDVFVHTTVGLIDLVGFTAWSSVREPIAVFQFLEQLYRNFDKLAAVNGVYKVETVRESYVAATGIPKAQPDHAVLMAQFAQSCMKSIPKLLRKLEVQFGPDTSDLALRIGVHSGPVTGGFLKGKGSRFQLFGDTMTTATLIQSLSVSHGVHLSEATAGMLVIAGKKDWVKEREDKVVTMEKGTLRTFWLVTDGHHGDLDFCTSMGSSAQGHTDSDLELGNQHRWIEWNVEIFKGFLKQIVARQANVGWESSQILHYTGRIEADATIPLEEVKEIVVLPKFDRKATRRQRENSDAEVPGKVVQELRDFITEISDLYNNDNPFHNFSHASNVVMAVSKYMSRIVAASEVELGDVAERLRSRVQAALHDHTYGITSDPLTQFACAFSALIHDVDHPGVPNQQLIKENMAVGLKYKNRSVAEQKSVDIALQLLHQDRFATLRSCLCQNKEEMSRFRALVINSVMATDLGDQELKVLRNSRWQKAFAKNTDDTTTDASISAAEIRPYNNSDEINRKATIVIEHLIQAADVAHMSQHWAIYRKWNERLFREVYKAYSEGRAETNPADGWYNGEIGFFDFYIIPLCKKLRDCGVFGPTGDENLNYATNNRNRWVQEGEAIVKDMLSQVESESNK